MRQIEEKGMDEELTWRDCPNCDGEGRIVDCRPGSGGGEACPHCSGGGKRPLITEELKRSLRDAAIEDLLCRVTDLETELEKLKSRAEVKFVPKWER
jgi:DnaJ-class molecular chaperone